MDFLKNLFKSKAKVDVPLRASAPVPVPTKTPDPVSGPSVERVSAASFLASVAAGDLEKVKAILKNFPALVSCKESGGWGETPLHKAVSEENIEMVKLLLANKADVNAKDANDGTPLFDAVNKNNEELVRVLLTGKPVINASSCHGGYRPLHSAKSRKIAELLITHGADVHVKNDSGSTPMHNAAQKGITDVVECLIAHGADVNAKNQYGASVVSMVAGSNTALIELLRKHGGR